MQLTFGRGNRTVTAVPSSKACPLPIAPRVGVPTQRWRDRTMAKSAASRSVCSHSPGSCNGSAQRPRALSRLWTWYQHRLSTFDSAVNEALGRLGAFVGRRPWHVLGTTLLVSLALSAGFALIMDRLENNSLRLWYAVSPHGCTGTFEHLQPCYQSARAVATAQDCAGRVAAACCALSDVIEQNFGAAQTRVSVLQGAAAQRGSAIPRVHCTAPG